VAADCNQVSYKLIGNQGIDLSYHIERKGLDHLCEGCIVAPINQQSGNREGDQDDQAQQESQEAGNAGGDGKIRQPDSSGA